MSFQFILHVCYVTEDRHLRDKTIHESSKSVRLTESCRQKVVKTLYFCVYLKDVRELKDQRDLLEFELEEMSQLSVS